MKRFAKFILSCLDETPMVNHARYCLLSFAVVILVGYCFDDAFSLLKTSFTAFVAGSVGLIFLAIRRSAAHTDSPRLGKLILCFLAPTDRQADIIGDFDELFTTVWAPTFGNRIAVAIYIWQSVVLGVTLVRAAVAAIITERLMRVFGF